MRTAFYTHAHTWFCFLCPVFGLFIKAVFELIANSCAHVRLLVLVFSGVRERTVGITMYGAAILRSIILSVVSVGTRARLMVATTIKLLCALER